MRIICVLKKCVKEILRDWKILIFSLIFGPAFVMIFHAFYSDTQTNYKVVVNNSDKQIVTKENVSFNAGDEFVKLLKSSGGKNDSIHYTITLEKDKDKALKDLKNKKYDVYIKIPEDFSQSIINQIENPQSSKTKITLCGDMGNSKYIIPAIAISSASEDYVSSITGHPKAINIEEESIVAYKSRTEFEATIPVCIFVGIIMIIFTSAIALIKEVEAGTIRRLQISKVSSWEMLTAVTISQLFIGIVSIALTLFTAFNIFNAKAEGPMLAVWVISSLWCLSIIAIGFILAGFSRNTSDILIIGNLPYFLLLLLSGAFPIPRINIASFGNHQIAINDIFPTTPGMTALKMVIEQGKNLSDVSFEIIFMLVLTAIYFVIGIYIFNRKHMKLS